VQRGSLQVHCPKNRSSERITSGTLSQKQKCREDHFRYTVTKTEVQREPLQVHCHKNRSSERIISGTLSQKQVQIYVVIRNLSEKLCLILQFVYRVPKHYWKDILEITPGIHCPKTYMKKYNGSHFPKIKNKQIFLESGGIYFKNRSKSYPRIYTKRY
jgi:hypothetical protein